MATPTPAMDLDAYLARIGLTRDALTADVSLTQLATIVTHHGRAIPFENLAGCGVFPIAHATNGEVVSLQLDNIVQKLVHDKRGGYCFEQNGLLAAVLRSLGYVVATHSARVVMANNDPEKAVYDLSGLSHAILIVDAMNASGEMAKYLCDVGFGGRGQPPCPMRLEPGAASRVEAAHGERYELAAVSLTHHWTTSDFSGRFVLAKAPTTGDQFAVYYRTGKDKPMFPSYVFSTSVVTTQADYAMANWYCSASPLSFLAQQPLVVRRSGATLWTLTANQFTKYEAGVVVDARTIDDKDALLALLATSFELTPTTKGP
ncbi:hypothetical protein SPRG_19600 [Saprolegnia parasitica CBS 223.65]|uniref:Uncharacterized protein n=2 Tax=Saprolegnia parasitica TaxID=101203 RepID=A0A067CWA5_SAPPC|nr:hypothetical protein SPRG_19600 [Saprolegnia parasitica CBS 223.65]KDO31077.1 hypothetical protein SPRG_19600 [Saprolegnia parasitica CBS 223.65]CBL43368.1 TPA: arylamine N-acetyltransferase 1 [Saprolegnia parasitica]|eukprot:XP_012198332.1 hypothetical protein SPRG_19600 [Saprolegnia parasitica CBS 223.65]